MRIQIKNKCGCGVENYTLERELTAAIARADAAEGALLRKGYRKSCEIPACNCGDNWTHGGHAAQRLSEISEALRSESPIDMDSKTLLQGVLALIRAAEERDAALAKLARYETLQPASEHDPDRDGNVRWFFHTDDYWAEVRSDHRRPQYATHWTPLPDVKEAK